MKKILLLGGSCQQVIAIKKAKELGFYTILCDYLSDNPGQRFADKFYPVSTTDKDAVLAIATSENIDGIVAYSSDPAAPTAAYVSEKLCLPGIPYLVAESFCNKHLFRQYLIEHGFNTPKSVVLNDSSSFLDVSELNYPIIIKPTDSSGSKGVSVIINSDELKNALNKAFLFSRNRVIIAEEYIERDHPDVIEAEIFVVDGKVKVWGLLNTIRDVNTNPLLPAAYSYPINIGASRIGLVKKEIEKLISSSGVKYGAFNIEMVISKDENLYFLDAGPRNGGNELPEFISDIARNDIVNATLLAAVGDYEKLKDITLPEFGNGYWGMRVIFSDKSGVFERVVYDDLAGKFLYHQCLFIKEGDSVSPFYISSNAIGLAFFHFKDEASRDEVLTDFSGKHIKVLVNGGK